MRPFYEPLAEIERLSRGKPGKIPKGKPRVTDGTLAGITRETSKRIVQQIPTGKVNVKDYPEYEQEINAVLTDIILPNANAGGTPYAKSKIAIKDVLRNGSSWAYCFYNRRGDQMYADFRRVYVKDIGFEKGKTSEFDSNFMFMTAWYTKSDLKSLIFQQQQLTKYNKEQGTEFKPEWDLKALQALIDTGEQEKDDTAKTEEEKKKNAGTAGYFKIVHCFQVGTGAKFYSYAPQIQKVVKTKVSNDPRGVMPLHGLVPEEDYSTPIGEPLLAISAGKQNLLDFDMQMYQYSQGLQYSPPVKKWGSVPDGKVKLIPDAIIDMGGPKTSGNDIEPLDIGTRATANFATNYGLIKSQIQNELGITNDTSISATSGNPGFSKTAQGVNALQERLGVADNDLRKSYEAWFGRICETMLNIHFAESKGIQELPIEEDTMKRMNQDANQTLQMDFDNDFGKIKFTVDASTSQAQDSQRENEELVGLLDVTNKYGGLRPDRQMAVVNQIIQNSGVDDPEKLMYTDDEINQARDMAMAPPPVDPMAVDPMAQPGAEQGMSMDAPMEAPVEEMPMDQGLSPEEEQFIQGLTERGYDQERIATAVAMLRNDYSDEEVMQVLGGNQ